MDGPSGHLRLVRAPGEGAAGSLHERFAALAQKHIAGVEALAGRPEQRRAAATALHGSGRARLTTLAPKSGGVAATDQDLAAAQRVPARADRDECRQPSESAPVGIVQRAAKPRESAAAACIVPHPRGGVAVSHRTPALDPSDARWVLAVLCWEWMEGGSAAILTPAKRAKLMRAAASMRLRRFDAGLIIAIVQDERRRGGASLSRLAGARLALVAPPAAAPATSFAAASLAALVLAGGMLAVMVVWVQGF